MAGRPLDRRVGVCVCVCVCGGGGHWVMGHGVDHHENRRSQQQHHSAWEGREGVANG